MVLWTYPNYSAKNSKQTNCNCQAKFLWIWICTCQFFFWKKEEEEEIYALKTLFVSLKYTDEGKHAIYKHKEN